MITHLPHSIHRRRAVALVVTLIMLAVITGLAVAFIALTRRETAAVDAMGRTTDAELAADSGLERAKAELMASFVRQNSGQGRNGAERIGPEFMVSVTYDGNRNYDPAKNLFLTNRVDPSVPVFVNTNRGSQNGPLDDRFFLDLNRDGRFQPSGFIDELDVNGNRTGLMTWVVGDPQWRGILQDPSQPHGPKNRYTIRYAYAMVPVGRGLDLNWIHNQTIYNDRNGDVDVDNTGSRDGYFRNQGFGAYEINLAALLADINSNVWHSLNPGAPEAYNFDPDPNPARQGSKGVAFLDARELLSFRYNKRVKYLASIDGMFPSVANNFQFDWIDGYGNGPVDPLGRSLLLTPNSETDLALGSDDARRPWPGAGGPRKFYTLHDFHDPQKLPNANGFRARLQRASAGAGTYDQYTYYRMLDVLGTESDDESGAKINLNYKDDAGYSASQFVEWDNNAGYRARKGMFTNIAARLLRNEAGVRWGPGEGIPVFTNNSPRWQVRRRGTGPLVDLGPLYSGRIHQLLQLAANICDASYSNKYDQPASESLPYYPSVFRPRFERRGSGIFIVDYDEVVNADAGDSPLRGAWVSLDDPGTHGQLIPNDNVNVYGIPVIIGARKGLPNFNEMVVQTAVDFTRKLQLRKGTISARVPFQTNQMLIVGVSNAFGIEAWYPYSYTNATTGRILPYPRRVVLSYSNFMTTTLTNNHPRNAARGGVIDDFPKYTSSSSVMVIDPANVSQSWTGGMFKVPPIVVQTSLPPSIYYPSGTTQFQLAETNRPNLFDTAGIYTNRWGLTVSNRFFYFLVDSDGQQSRIIDAATFSDASTSFDISRELTRGEGDNPIANQWSIALNPRTQGILGIENQIAISLGAEDFGQWNDWGGLDPIQGLSKEKSISYFRRFLGLPATQQFPTNNLPPETLDVQAPFTPARKMYQTTTWQANDPLVHYRVEDLRNSTDPAPVFTARPITRRFPLEATEGYLSMTNTRYNPWAGRDRASTSATDYDTTVKDAGIFSPDDWDFPTAKFPNVGWLGRVHRGTPWQTVYFKSLPASPQRWRDVMRGYSDAQSGQLMPTNDWRLADLFTVAVHPNQTRGRLSINQTNHAAWSAVLSGIQVTKILEDPSTQTWYRTNEVIQPTAVDFQNLGNDAPVLAIVNGRFGINTNRGPNRTYRALADVLAVPALTDRSPYLAPPFSTRSWSQFQSPFWKYPALDSDIERIPQQILSLLHTGESRFVVYAWGQSLKPAGPVQGFGPSIVTSSNDRGLVKNYQVTGEMATRAVIRVEFDDELRLDQSGNVERDPNTGEPIRTGRKDYRRPHAVVESFNIIPVE